MTIDYNELNVLPLDACHRATHETEEGKNVYVKAKRERERENLNSFHKINRIMCVKENTFFCYIADLLLVVIVGST